MSRAKSKLGRGEVALGGWMLLPHPGVAELLAGEGFDWVAVDMEHAAGSVELVEQIVRAVQPWGCDMLVRLDGVNPLLAKHVMDAGADGVIVPMVMSAEDAATMVAAVRYPPEGNRGTSLARATDYGRNFKEYIGNNNSRVFVAVMLEHYLAAERSDEILATPGIDAAFIGPYDLSASLGVAGELSDPRVLEAEAKVLAACKRHGVAPGYHVVAPEPQQVRERMEAGYRFIGCSLDTHFIMHGARNMLSYR